MKISEVLLFSVGISAETSKGWIQEVDGTYIPTPNSAPSGVIPCNFQGKDEWTEGGEGGDGSHTRPYYGVLVRDMEKEGIASRGECDRRFLVKNFQGEYVEIRVAGYNSEYSTDMLVGPETCKALVGAGSCSDLPLYPLPSLNGGIQWTGGVHEFVVMQEPATACEGFEKIDSILDGRSVETARQAVICLKKAENNSTFCGNTYKVEDIYFKVVAFQDLRFDRQLATDKPILQQVWPEGYKGFSFGEFIEGVIGDLPVKSRRETETPKTETPKTGSSIFNGVYLLVFWCSIF